MCLANLPSIQDEAARLRSAKRVWLRTSGFSVIAKLDEKPVYTGEPHDFKWYPEAPIGHSLWSGESCISGIQMWQS